MTAFDFLLEHMVEELEEGDRKLDLESDEEDE